MIKFATRIPAFMYLTDFRENTLKDVITKLGAGPLQGCHGFDCRRLPSACVAQRLQQPAHEPGCVCLPPVRRLLFVLHRHRQPRGPPTLGLYDTVVAREV